MAASSRQKSRRQYTKHRLWSLKSAVRLLGGRAIDRRTAVGQALEAWRQDLIADLGGREALSVQRLQLVDVVIKSKLLLDSIDAYLLQQRTLVNARKRALLPVVRERQALADSLVRQLQVLGLERVKPPGSTLAEIVARLSAPAPVAPPATKPGGTGGSDAT